MKPVAETLEISKNNFSKWLFLFGQMGWKDKLKMY